MNYRIIFFTVTLAVLLMGTVLFYVVSAGALKVQTAVLEEQEGSQLANPYITKGIFSVGLPVFEEFAHACTVPFLDEVYVNVVLRYLEVPRSCEFFMNGRYVTTENKLQPDCIKECPAGEFSRTFALGSYDVRESHSLRVCCNDICIERGLSPMCSNSTSTGSNSG